VPVASSLSLSLLCSQPASPSIAAAPSSPPLPREPLVWECSLWPTTQRSRALPSGVPYPSVGVGQNVAVALSWAAAAGPCCSRVCLVVPFRSSRLANPSGGMLFTDAHRSHGWRTLSLFPTSSSSALTHGCLWIGARIGLAFAFCLCGCSSPWAHVTTERGDGGEEEGGRGGECVSTAPTPIQPSIHRPPLLHQGVCQDAWSWIQT